MNSDHDTVYNPLGIKEGDRVRVYPDWAGKPLKDGKKPTEVVDYARRGIGGFLYVLDGRFAVTGERARRHAIAVVERARVAEPRTVGSVIEDRGAPRLSLRGEVYPLYVRWSADAPRPWHRVNPPVDWEKHVFANLYAEWDDFEDPVVYTRPGE